MGCGSPMTGQQALLPAHVLVFSSSSSRGRAAHPATLSSMICASKGLGASPVCTMKQMATVLPANMLCQGQAQQA